MLIIKKYANGKFFDTAAKKYIKTEKMVEIIKKGEEIQVILTKTGKDITDAVIGQFSKKGDAKIKKQSKEKKKNESSLLKTDKLTKWLGEMIDTKIEKVLDIIKLPTREQVAKLDENIKELNKKIDSLKLSQEKAVKKKAANPKKPATSKQTSAAKNTMPENMKSVADKLGTETKRETTSV